MVPKGSPRSIPAPVRRAMRELAGNLTTWRKLRGLTQAQVAERAGVSRNTVVALERGDVAISTENLIRILRALGVLDRFARALDPYESDIGRLRSDQILPRRVRPRTLDDGDA